MISIFVPKEGTMATNSTITLSHEQETLLIPLFGKAKYQHIFSNEKAKFIIEKIDYNFEKLNVPQKTATTLVVRAQKLDEITKKFIQKHPDGTILHLGCGLDSRCLRVDHPTNQWFDLDFPEVISLRKNFFEENELYKMISSSVTDLAWLNQVPVKNESYLIIAEGLFMYLYEQNIKELFQIWKNRFQQVEIAFDVFSEYTVANISKHPSMQKTGATIRWGIDHAEDIEKWLPGYTLIEEWFFNQSPLISKLNPFYKFMFKLTANIEIAKKAQRILYFRL
jgi:O-methyltransferase involved in polyketide biosynthesis